MSNNTSRLGDLLDEVFAEAASMLDNATSVTEEIQKEFNSRSKYQQVFMTAMAENAPTGTAINEFLKMAEATCKSADRESIRLQTEIDGIDALNITLKTFVALKGLPFNVTISKR
jgi:hypothetical protein